MTKKKLFYLGGYLSQKIISPFNDSIMSNVPNTSAEVCVQNVEHNWMALKG